jgi:signal peptidase I
MAAAASRSPLRRLGGRLGCLLVGVLAATTGLRLWMLEGLLFPVRIAGGSMAPALVGEHVRQTCSDCQYPFVYDALHPAELGAVCPNCGYRHTNPSAVVERGQRVLIDRFSLGNGLPQRWDLVAFTDPDKPGLSSVKRVMGMPHEQIEIRGGELYVDGQLLQKSLAEFRHMAILVHDDTFRPRLSRSLPLRWRPANPTSRWITTPHGYSCGPVKPSANVPLNVPVVTLTGPMHTINPRSSLYDFSSQIVPPAHDSDNNVSDHLWSQSVRRTQEIQTKRAAIRSDRWESHATVGRSASHAVKPLSKSHPLELRYIRAAEKTTHTVDCLGEFVGARSARVAKTNVGLETMLRLESGQAQPLGAAHGWSTPFPLPSISDPCSSHPCDRQKAKTSATDYFSQWLTRRGAHPFSGTGLPSSKRFCEFRGVLPCSTPYQLDLLTNRTWNVGNDVEEATQAAAKTSEPDGATPRVGDHDEDHHSHPQHAIIENVPFDTTGQPWDWLVYENWRCYANPFARSDGVPVSDHYGYNQGVSRQTKDVTDLVLSGCFEWDGNGRLVLAIYDGREWITCLLSTGSLHSDPTQPVQGELGTREKNVPPLLDSVLPRLKSIALESLVPELHQPERSAAGLATRDEPGALGPHVAPSPSQSSLSVIRSRTIGEQNRRGSSNSSSSSFVSQERSSAALGELSIYQGVSLLVKTNMRLPAPLRLEFGLIDQQVLVAIDGRELGRWSYVTGQRPRKSLAHPLALACSAGLTLNVRDLRIHRDVYYLDPHNTGQPWKMPHALGPQHWLLLGDNVPISRDGRHGRSPGLDQRFLRGRVLRPFLPQARSCIMTRTDR